MKINSGTYYVVHSWMTKDLGLKGLDRDLYAIIYGFSQDRESNYHGSLQYLSELTGYSRQSIIPSLRSLVERGLIIKYQDSPVKIRYKVNYEKTVNLFNSNSKDSLQLDSKLSLQNNIDNNKDIKNNNESLNTVLEDKDSYNINKQIREEVDEVINFMNATWHKNFRKSPANIKIIKARLKDYSLDDLKKVILDRWEKWGKNPIKFSGGQTSDTYLRPQTVFNVNKFDNYLNEANSNNNIKVVSSERSTDRSNEVF